MRGDSESASKNTSKPICKCLKYSNIRIFENSLASDLVFVFTLRLEYKKVGINWLLKSNGISAVLIQLIKLSSAEQSTTWESSTADKAIDGTTDGIYDKELVLSSIRLKSDCFDIDFNVLSVPETDTLIFIFILGRTKEN